MRRTLVLAGLLTALPTVLHGQQVHGGLLWGRTRVPTPGAWEAKQTLHVPTLVAGVTLPAGMLLEARASRMHASTEAIAFDGPTVAITTDALMTEAVVGAAPPSWRMGAFQPRATAGVMVARVTDSYRADTPEEHVRTTVGGLTMAAGADVAVGGPVLFRLQGSWRHLNEKGRPAARVGLGHASLEIGLLLRR